jgi:hypothetical protein
MQSASGASNTQKTIILSLSEGWSLRQNDVYGWCLFQPGRARPFAKVKQRTVEAMTDRGWIIEPLSATDALPMQPSRELTPLGWKYADRLVRRKWAETYKWDPYDHTVTRERTANFKFSDAA